MQSIVEFAATGCGFFGGGMVLLYISPMYVIDNAEFIPKGPIGHDSLYKAPSLSGDLLVKMSERELGRVHSILDAADMDRIEYTDRSSHSQLHLETDVPLEQGIPDGNKYAFPMRIISLRPDTEQWLNSIRRIGRLKMGRLLLLDETQAFDAATLERLWHEDHELEFPQGTIIDPTTDLITAPIDAHVEYDLDGDPLRKHMNRKYLLEHGRRGLKNFQDVRRKLPDDAVLAPGQSFVGGMRFSTGPYNAIIQRDLGNSIHHLGAVLLDEYRSTGTDNGHLRQGEFVNLGSKPVSRKDMAVRMRLFPSTDNAPDAFPESSVLSKKRMHREGVVLSDILSLEPDNLKQWFANIAAHPQNEGHGATVVSLDGATHVPWQAFYHRQKRAITRAAFEGERSPSEDHADLSKGLEFTSANGRIIISYHLPSASHLEELAANGVRSFVFRGMRLPKEVFSGENPRPQNNFYLDQGLHTKLMELEHQGCEFIWWPESKSGDEKPRTFYKGFFVQPEEKDRYDRFRKNGIGVAMFGTSSTKIEPLLREPIQKFGEGLRNVFDDGTQIAIMDGNGPGVMRLAREMAEKQKYLRMSFGMDFEQVGEVPDFGSEALLLFQDDQIEYRQTFFEYLHTITVCNIGGDGTDYERVLAKLKVSLLNSLPLPMYWVDGRQGAREHFYEGALHQQKSMTAGEYGFPGVAKEWVDQLIVRAKDYDEVLSHMATVLPNLDQFWHQAGIPKQVLARAYKSHTEQCKKVNIQLPDLIADAYHRFCLTD